MPSLWCWHFSTIILINTTIHTPLFERSQCSAVSACFLWGVIIQASLPTKSKYTHAATTSNCRQFFVKILIQFFSRITLLLYYVPELLSSLGLLCSLSNFFSRITLVWPTNYVGKWNLNRKKKNKITFLNFFVRCTLPKHLRELPIQWCRCSRSRYPILAVVHWQLH